jgi:ribosomal protein L17
MKIIKKDEWHSRHSLLTKFFIERTIQMVDYDENISNKHRTVNGLIMIDEVIELCKMILLRQKSVNRLKSILTEAIEDKISANIANDYVLREGGFSDIIKFYNEFNLESLQRSGGINEKAIKDLATRSQIHAKRLETFYFKTIKQHFQLLDEDPSRFRRNAVILDSLLNSLIPFLLYQGYSATSINEVTTKLISKPGINPFDKFFAHFDLVGKSYTFLINIGNAPDEYCIFIDQLNKKKVSYTELAQEELKNSIFYNKVKVDYEENDKFIKIQDKALDPHSYLTELYDFTFKQTVLAKDRKTLQFYTVFFKYSYWKGDNVQKYQPITVNLDPIDTLNRKSTLRESLRKLSGTLNFKFNENTDLPYIPDFEQSVYYYNLALGSKSIENSLSLLWTALESLVPYHPKQNDIDNIQFFVSNFLSVGAIGRQLNSFFLRLKYSNVDSKQKLFEKIGINTFQKIQSEKGLKQWMKWLTHIHTDKKTDPFHEINSTSVLLCYQYCNINEKWGGKLDSTGKACTGKVENFISKIENSRLSIHHQLDRIYLHRNQIVHSGKFINEYSNMWSHLEWYVGKLLTFGFVYHFRTGRFDFSKKEAFLKLEGEVEHIKNILEINRNKDISEIEEHYPTIFRLIWQYF